MIAKDENLRLSYVVIDDVNALLNKADLIY